MAPVREGEYMIQTNGQSSARLNFQHFWVEECLGYLLHPNIPVSDNAKVADIATGTGIWPIAYSRRVPSTVQVDGFDITDDMFPPADWLPSNVSLRTLDILKPIPEELKGQYDVVCIRYFGVLIKNNKPDFVLRNLVDMLKPGGYIQWVEADIYNQRVVESARYTLSSPTTLEQHLQGWQKYLDSSELRYDWLKTLPDICKSIGMSEANLYIPEILPAYRFTASTLVLGAWEEMTYKCLDERPDEFLGTGSELREKIAGFRKEVDQGAGLDLDYYVTVARKWA
ncbi:S-adenosyl-L-methionine-dependent methyltransferase [Aspergillus granulosus]|uniref:S-adenosyl-L-methionine-dependent methyltransferase n=1 Tax=Aspergillus granulosus TaxID=176169 RepID=A0ABR4H7G6_9EURO